MGENEGDAWRVADRNLAIAGMSSQATVTRSSFWTRHPELSRSMAP